MSIVSLIPRAILFAESEWWTSPDGKQTFHLCYTVYGWLWTFPGHAELAANEEVYGLD